jgi:hypothetical protein
MKKIIIAYHAYLVEGFYQSMIEEQFNLLLKSGLYDICDKFYIGIVDPSGNSKFVLPEKAECVSYPDNKEETETLKWIKEYSQNNLGDYVLYFHTKGISRISPATESWRKYMEYFVIEKWTNCVQKLDEGYDCCGVEWRTDWLGDLPHFSGNFWWSTTDYINTLDHSYLDKPGRYFRESWIGSNIGVKKFEFHHRGGDGYSIIYNRSKYEQ